MTTLTMAQVKDLGVDEIDDQLKKSHLELVELRMKLAIRQLEDTSLLKKKKKEIARLLTLKTKKQRKEDVVSEKKIKATSQKKKRTISKT